MDSSAPCDGTIARQLLAGRGRTGALLPHLTGCRPCRDHLAAQQGVSDELVAQIRDRLRDRLGAGGQVVIAGFGLLAVRHLPASEEEDFRTGRPVAVPERVWTLLVPSGSLESFVAAGLLEDGVQEPAPAPDPPDPCDGSTVRRWLVGERRTPDLPGERRPEEEAEAMLAHVEGCLSCRAASRDDLRLPPGVTDGVFGPTSGVIAQRLADGHHVPLPEIGVFGVRRRAAHEGLNPVTGARLAIPPRVFVTFVAHPGLHLAT